MSWRWTVPGVRPRGVEAISRLQFLRSPVLLRTTPMICGPFPTGVRRPQTITYRTAARTTEMATSEIVAMTDETPSRSDRNGGGLVAPNGREKLRQGPLDVSP